MTTTRNYRYLTTIVIVRGYLLGALYFSATDIQHAFGMLGLEGVRQQLSPLALDGFAVLGMLARSKYFAESTRRIGLRVQIVASIASLAGNIYAGHNAGERLFGALLVGGYVFSEWFGDHMKPAEADTTTAAALAQAEAHRLALEAAAAQAAADQAAAAKRSKTARKAAATRKRNAAAKVEADRLQAETEALELAFAAEAAPVSPSPLAPLATTYM